MASIIYQPPGLVVPFVERTHPEIGPRESMDRGGSRATRVLDCNWNDRWRLADAIMNAYTIIINDGTGNRTFFKPDKFPHRTGMYANAISAMIPFGKSAQGDTKEVADWPIPARALLTVEYKTADFDDSTDQDDSVVKYADESLNVAAEYLTLPSKSLTWDAAQNDPLGDDATASKVIRMIEWNFTFTELGNLPQTLLDSAGKVNSVLVTSRTLGLTFAAEQCLYNGVKAQRELFIDGARAWQATLSFLFKSYSWNKFFKPKEELAQEVFADGSVFKPYEQVAFSTLGV